MQSIQDQRQHQQKLYSQSFHHRATHTVDFHAFRHISTDPLSIRPQSLQPHIKHVSMVNYFAAAAAMSL